MGAFYTQFVLKGAARERVLSAMEGRNAVVIADTAGWLVVCDEEADDQSEELFEGLAEYLSAEAVCTVLAIQNHDDSILSYCLYVKGERKDSYDSNPEYFDEGPALPTGGVAETLCAAFGCDGVAVVEGILRADPGEEYVFESERHADLARALQLPEWSVGLGFSYLAQGEVAEELRELNVTRTEKFAQEGAAKAGFYKVVLTHPETQELFSIPIGWLPSKLQKQITAAEGLTERVRRAIAGQATTLTELGFGAIAYQKLVDILNPKFLDGGGAIFLHESGDCIGQLKYILYAGVEGEVETTVCAIHAEFSSGMLGCTNEKRSLLVNPRGFEVVYVESDDPKVIFERFQEKIANRQESPMKFKDLSDIEKQFELDAQLVLQTRVDAGQYVLMDAFEVWRARKAQRSMKGEGFGEEEGN